MTPICTNWVHLKMGITTSRCHGYLLVNVLVILDGGAFGMVTGRGGGRGETAEQTAGVLLLTVNELLHEALSMNRYTHTHTHPQHRHILPNCKCEHAFFLLNIQVAH